MPEDVAVLDVVIEAPAGFEDAILSREPITVVTRDLILACLVPRKSSCQSFLLSIDDLSNANISPHVLKCIEDRTKYPPIMAPSAVLSGRRKPTKSKKQQGAQKRKRDDVDVEKLEQAVENLVCLLPSHLYGSD